MDRIAHWVASHLDGTLSVVGVLLILLFATSGIAGLVMLASGHALLAFGAIAMAVNKPIRPNRPPRVGGRIWRTDFAGQKAAVVVLMPEPIGSRYADTAPNAAARRCDAARSGGIHPVSARTPHDVAAPRL